MKREDQIELEIQALSEEREQIRSRKTIKCECGKRTPLKKLIAIREYYYVSPHGCTGGDYWDLSNEYTWYCSKCEKWHRVYKSSFDSIQFPDAKNLPLRATNYEFLHSHIQYVGEVLDRYGKHDGDTLTEIREANAKREARKESSIF